MKVAAPLAAVLCFACLRTTSASTFILDPEESYLTMEGSSYGLPALAQAPGSFTTSLSGSLQIGQNTVDALQITGSLLNHSEQLGAFAPLGTTASFAGQVNYSNGRSSYFAARHSHSHLWGSLPVAGSAGQYSTDKLKLTFATSELVGKRPSDQYPYVEAISKTLDMAIVGPAALTAVGAGYRVEIPIASNSIPVLSNNLDIQFTGKLVGYSDIDPRLTPEIVDGSFLRGQGWYDPDRRGQTHINSIYEQSTQADFHDAGSASLFTAPDFPARLVQEILGPGMLLPNTLYQVTFDVGNGTTEEEHHSVGDRDRDASVDVYWSLGGLTRSGDYDAAGGVYRLDQLSDIPDEEWRPGQSILFDTSHLTPEQLAQGANLVLQASSPVLYWRSEVRFASVRIAIVPEPSSLLLALSAVFLGLMFARRSRRRSALNISSQSP
jgi:hypothetical protein